MYRCSIRCIDAWVRVRDSYETCIGLRYGNKRIKIGFVNITKSITSLRNFRDCGMEVLKM